MFYVNFLKENYTQKNTDDWEIYVNFWIIISAFQEPNPGLWTDSGSKSMFRGAAGESCISKIKGKKL